MIVLDLPTQTLEVVCGGAAAATNPQWSVAYTNISKNGAETYSLGVGNTNGGTDQTIVTAPKAGDKHIIKAITLFNADNGNTTVTFKVNNGSDYILYKVTLATLENLTYESGHGWRAYTTAGALK